MGTPQVSWHSIRALDGSQRSGFEELCAQLAKQEIPESYSFWRKGNPDAGVECYATTDTGREWGWQAKYFHTLGPTQWSELDESVNTALKKHPELEKYFVCVPLDLPDARIEDQKSAMDRWKERVLKWQSLATKPVSFVLWGSHDLLTKLAEPHNRGRLCFFFSERGFDPDWFLRRLHESISTAGARYTPELHVDLPIAAEFEALGRTETFFARLLSLARPLRKHLGSIKTARPPEGQEPPPSLQELISETQCVIAGIAAIAPSPTRALALDQLAMAARSAVDLVEATLSELQEAAARQPEGPPSSASGGAREKTGSEHQRMLRYHLQELESSLASAATELSHANQLTSAPAVLIAGAAGTGKTHLLCDVARHRLASSRPTILLMGQRFVGEGDAWTQAAQQLDLPGISSDEFIGALEAVAEARQSRALILIDALNEGAGRTIWPAHLPALMTQIQSSEWISAVFSVRSSFTELVVPEQIRATAITVQHDGFADHEYDASHAFFAHYGLEIPSTPLLSPEFRNPLFLKTMCRGLSGSGQRRFPRGFQGISAIFSLYLEAVNKRLASDYGFNDKSQLVKKALEAFTLAAYEINRSWLSLDRAEQTINALLPGRNFHDSLYRALVSEGLIIEDVRSHGQGHREEIASIGYERFADYFIASALLDKHLNEDTPQSCFEDGGSLDFLRGNSTYVAPGVLEALCVLVPERTGLELPAVVSLSKWGMAAAFHQSLIWRSPEAFTDATLEVLNAAKGESGALDESLETLLTVATLPQHPWNAAFLDRNLRRESVAERDAWWSVYLHSAWGSRGAVDRIVDWARSLKPGTAVDDEVAELSATVLAWMCSTSNRFLRDRATKGLVSLLSGKASIMAKIVGKFAGVDDPYIRERVYAAALGVAARCNDATEARVLGEEVFARVFDRDEVDPHILLRDYARGVVERWLLLDPTAPDLWKRVAPPYASRMPVIPTDDDVAPLKEFTNGSDEDGRRNAARNRIVWSVMHDDFARYVIGTNASKTSHYWLNRRMSDPPWVPPPTPDDLLSGFRNSLDATEREAWDRLRANETVLGRALRLSAALLATLPVRLEKRDLAFESAEDGKAEREAEIEVSAERLAAQREAGLQTIRAALTAERTASFDELVRAVDSYPDERQPPGFELAAIQRYVLWRVFDLGWTTERFGTFDQYYVRSSGRQAAKAERMGKKYQWIAYHELLAYLSDHYQYRRAFSWEDRTPQAYIGSWQGWWRDIDPTSLTRSLPGGTSWSGHAVSWWCPAEYQWNTSEDAERWASRHDDVPLIDSLLFAKSPDATEWIDLECFLIWREPAPPDRDPLDVPHREIWCQCTGYLVPAAQAPAFVEWAKEVDFWGKWMPAPAVMHEVFLGEYPWGAAARDFDEQFFRGDEWVTPEQGCPSQVRAAACEFGQSNRDSDCSADDSFSLHLPTSRLIRDMGLHWTGTATDYADESGQLTAMDPAAHVDGPGALLVRAGALREFLRKNDLSICWTVLGEKRAHGRGMEPGPHLALRMSGAYRLGPDGLVGFLNFVRDEDDEPGRVVATRTTGAGGGSARHARRPRRGAS